MEQKDKLWTANFIKACFANFLIACSFYLFMPTIPIYLSDKLGIPDSKVGMVLSSYVIALLFVRPFSGFLVDVYKRKPLLLSGVTLFVLTYFGYYFAATAIFFIVLRFIHGAFWGISSVSANTIAIDIIPSSRRGEGIGIFGVNLNIAMAIAPYFGVVIYDNFGFNMLISAALVMGSMAIFTFSLIQVKEREQKKEKQVFSFDRFILVKGIPILINQLFLAFGWGVLSAFAVLYGKHININNPGVFFIFLASGIVISRITAGKLVDKGFLHSMMIMAIIAIVFGYVGFALVKTTTVFCVSAFILGIGYGILFPSLQTIYNNMATPDKRGTANSTYLTGFDIGIGMGMLFGAYMEELHGFTYTYLFTAALSFIALFIYIFNSRKVYDRNRLI